MQGSTERHSVAQLRNQCGDWGVSIDDAVQVIPLHTHIVHFKLDVSGQFSLNSKVPLLDAG